jgi:helicase required for RNAi-mediated heterochromatin assembly 1
VFSLSRIGKKIRWEQSKRLIAGTLVALSPTKDMFKTKCIVAVVAARPMDLIQEDPPKLDLFFANHEDIDLDPSIEYFMVEERTSFFESVRYVHFLTHHLFR